MENLLIIAGPTGVGKTEISLELAEKFNMEIISADSMQIYRDMDIGTAKVKPQEAVVKHHLVDFLDPESEYSVSDFKNEAIKLILDLNKNAILPTIVGGTGLYINSLVYDLNFQNTSSNLILRDELNKIYEEKGLGHLFEILKNLNEETALKIDRYNKNRVIRAIEIIKSGNEYNEYNKKVKNDKYNLLYFCINLDRKLLYDKINLRVEKMIDAGLIDEVRSLTNRGLNLKNQSMKAIGYREVYYYLNGLCSFIEMKENIKKHSRHLAKRQLTWFKRDPRIIWIDRNDPAHLNFMSKLIREKYGDIY